MSLYFLCLGASDGSFSLLMFREVSLVCGKNDLSYSIDCQKYCILIFGPFSPYLSPYFMFRNTTTLTLKIWVEAFKKRQVAVEKKEER